MSTDSPKAPAALSKLMSEPFPQQTAFRYKKASWLNWLGHIPEASDQLNAMPESIDRGAATDLVGRTWLENPAGAFITAMAWGHGLSGYGPYRVAQILTQSQKPLTSNLDGTVTDKLRESARVARAEGPVKGFYYLNNNGRIKWLAAAFFTKWLYFSSTSDPGRTHYAAPVLDRLIIEWLRGTGILLRPNRTPDYEKYVTLLAEWGKPHELAPTDVEERIFRLIRDDGVRA